MNTSFTEALAQWQAALTAATDAELLERFNREVGSKGWTSARAHYLHALQQEIKNRNWDSTLLFGQDADSGLPTLHLHQKVALVNQVIVPSV
jgi:hypothetical protein